MNSDTRHCITVQILSILFSCALATAVAAADKSESPSHLTARHVGEYAGVPWVETGAAITPGSREDRVRDLNFSVASVNLKDDMSDAFLKMWADRARWAREQNKAFLPRVYFWDGNDRFEGPLRDIDVYWKRLDTFLAAMDLDDFTGIVLAEENIDYLGRAAVLRELYRRVKEKYDVAVWQWWSPMRSVPSTGGWIPADGWVIDLYFMGQPAFRRMVRKYLISGKPLVVMPWAAQMDLNGKMTESQWTANRAQLETAVEFNLPAAFFWIYGVSVHFGGGRGEPQTEIDRINHMVWDYIKRVRKLPAEYDGLPSADLAEGDIHEIGPTEGDLLVYTDAFADEKCVDDASMTGFRDFVLDGNKLAARGYHGRAVDCSLEYRFQGELQAAHPQMGLDVTVNTQLDGKVELALSTEGKNWLTASSTPQAGSQRLQLTSAGKSEFSKLRDFRVRIHITGKSADDGAPAVQIDNLRIEAGLAAPDERTVRLKSVSDDGKSLEFDEQFLSQKYRWLAQLTNEPQIVWSKGQIGVRMRPGGSAGVLVWKVSHPEPLQNIRVQLEGRANSIHLGTFHYLDISTDGKTWRHEVNTSGKEGDVNGWIRENLTIDVGNDPEFEDAREFFVRLRMNADSFKEEHPVLSGLVNRLTIRANEAMRD